MTTYDVIGKTYAATRAADPRIVERLATLLALRAGHVVADVGAGTGTYARALAERAAHVLAVEPSEVMRSQAAPHPAVQWLAGSATPLPLPDESVDSVIAVLSVHHFPDFRAAFREMQRVRREGPIVVFTFDPWLHEAFWLYEYFPWLKVSARATYPATAELAEALRGAGAGEVSVDEFALPVDLSDRFVASGWGRPEIYLDATCRRNMSPFAAMPDAEVAAGITRLSDDLRSGRWDARFGGLRSADELRVGYAFVCGAS